MINWFNEQFSSKNLVPIKSYMTNKGYYVDGNNIFINIKTGVIKNSGFIVKKRNELKNIFDIGNVIYKAFKSEGEIFDNLDKKIQEDITKNETDPFRIKIIKTIWKKFNNRVVLADSDSERWKNWLKLQKLKVNKGGKKRKNTRKKRKNKKRKTKKN